MFQCIIVSINFLLLLLLLLLLLRRIICGDTRCVQPQQALYTQLAAIRAALSLPVFKHMMVVGNQQVSELICREISVLYLVSAAVKGILTLTIILCVFGKRLYETYLLFTYHNTILMMPIHDVLYGISYGGLPCCSPSFIPQRSVLSKNLSVVARNLKLINRSYFFSHSCVQSADCRWQDRYLEFV